MSRNIVYVIKKLRKKGMQIDTIALVMVTRRK